MRTCSLPGCDKAHRARGLCSGHWTQEYGKPTTYPIACKVCQKEHQSSRKTGTYCSETCRGIDQRGKTQEGRPWTRRQRALIALHWAAKGTVGGTWICGTCAQCGDAFTAKGRPRFCSRRCAGAKKNRVRRARKSGAEREYYTRMSIFVRDKWRCHICTRKVLRTKRFPHPLAPTLDHLIPLAEGGSDTPANVATAHFMCNSTKRDKGGNEQLALVG